MLEWRPRLIAILVLVVLVALALATGYLKAGPYNWEW
jgi:hypothetical protein